MPRKKRAFSTQRRLHSETARASPKRPKRRKEWHDDSMKAAIKAVEEGQTISKGARYHGVPKKNTVQSDQGEGHSWD